MKKRIIILIVIFTAIFLFYYENIPQEKYDAMPGNAAAQTPGITINSLFQPCCNNFSDRTWTKPPVNCFASVYPNEIYLGDPLYIDIQAQNDRETPIQYGGSILHYTVAVANINDIPPDYIEQCKSDVKHFYGNISKGKLQILGYPNRMVGDGFPSTGPPKSCVRMDKIRIELPYLNELKESFWKSFFKEGEESKDVCLLIFCREYFSLAVVKIKVKKRPERENDLFKRWLEKIPAQCFPASSIEATDEGYPRFPVKARNIRLGNTHFFPSRYPLGYFMQTTEGAFKPSQHNVPTTIQGWRELERSLVPSTMRDEIQMTRMLLEYYDASGDAQDKKLAEIKAWLESLPPVQASILARYYDAPKNSPLYDAAQKIKPVIKKQSAVSG